MIGRAHIADLSGSAQAAKRSIARSAGMTLPELILGLSLMIIVGAAAASVLMTTARGWEQTQSQQSASTSATLTRQHLVAKLRGVRYLGHVKKGSLDNSTADVASVIYWNDDNFGTTAGDATPQYGELSVLEFDPEQQAIFLYETAPYNTLTGDAKTTLALSPAEFQADVVNDPNAAEQLKTLLINQNALRRTKLASDVHGAEFAVVHANDSAGKGRPAIELMLRGSKRKTIKTSSAASAHSPGVPAGQGLAVPLHDTQVDYVHISLRAASKLPTPSNSTGTGSTANAG